MSRFPVLAFTSSITGLLKRSALSIPIAAFVLALQACGGGSSGGATPAPMAATVPGAPSNVMATAGNASATISWSAPANGGSPITGYTITANPGGAMMNAAGSALSVNFSGLTNGQSYTFAVYAVNAIGNGPSTSSGAVRPATVPAAPTGVTASAGNASAQVTWTAPSDGGSPITGYTVTVSPGGGVVMVGAGATTTAVSGLMNGQSYTFTVFASNAAGSGAASAPSNAVTPSASTVNITVSPTRAALTTGPTQQFTATVTGTASTGATWSVDGIPGGNATVGTITSGGLYSPPTAAGTHAVTATSQADTSKSATASVIVTDLAGVFTYHNDAARTGQNLQEYALTPAVVSTPSAFGKLFSCPVDAAVYAQPLYVANLQIGSGALAGIHNVLFVVTENDSVYAFDADSSACTTYWFRSFLVTNVTAIPSTDTNVAPTQDLPGTMGITGTPVIDPARGLLYLVARFKNSTTTTPVYTADLHALNLATGADGGPGYPVSISGSVPGTAQGTTTVTFNPLKQSQRPALLSLNGNVYAAFGSAEDSPPYNGWIFGWDGLTLVQMAVFNSTPNGGQTTAAGAFWMTGSGPAADPQGNIYAPSANGVFDNTANAIPPVVPNNDMADSLLKLNQTLVLQDFFTPSTQATLASTDMDFGSGGLVVLPDSMGNTAHPHLVVATDKTGVFWLVDRDNPGRYLTGTGGTDGNVQKLSAGLLANQYFFSTPAIFGSTMYMIPNTIDTYSISNAHITAGAVSTDVFSQQGATPSISAQGSNNGILWAIDNGNNGATFSNTNPGTLGAAILRAYDAGNVSTRLFSSDANTADACGNAVKFTVPTVANGKVYVGGNQQVTVYGLKP